MSDLVLVTGVTGFIASHVTERLLNGGYRVRGTARNAQKAERIVSALQDNGVDTTNLEIVEADLGHDTGWKAAIEGCRYVQHIASPFPLEAPPNREALVPEARAGAMRVIEHALGQGIERVVMTSSMVAMMGQPDRGEIMHVTEQDWSDPDWKPLTAYPVSKTRAELAVWEYARAKGLEENLAVVNPGLVFGPDTYHNAGASLGLIKAMFKGDFPRAPKIAYGIVDVRDLASLHVKAMITPKCGGRRLIGASNTLWFREIGEILRAEYPRAKKIPTQEFANFMVKLVGLIDDRVKGIIPDLGIFHTQDTAYVTSLTGVIFRPAKEAVLAAAESLAAHGDVEIS